MCATRSSSVGERSVRALWRCKHPVGFGAEVCDGVGGLERSTLFGERRELVVHRGFRGGRRRSLRAVSTIHNPRCAVVRLSSRRLFRRARPRARKTRARHNAIASHVEAPDPRDARSPSSSFCSAASTLSSEGCSPVATSGREHCFDPQSPARRPCGRRSGCRPRWPRRGGRARVRESSIGSQPARIARPDGSAVSMPAARATRTASSTVAIAGVERRFGELERDSEHHEGVGEFVRVPGRPRELDPFLSVTSCVLEVTTKNARVARPRATDGSRVPSAAWARSATATRSSARSKSPPIVAPHAAQAATSGTSG